MATTTLYTPWNVDSFDPEVAGCPPITPKGVGVDSSLVAAVQASALAALGFNLTTTTGGAASPLPVPASMDKLTALITASGVYAPAADNLALTRLERQTRQQINAYNSAVAAQFADSTVVSELWANTTAWGGTATVAGGKMYASTNGLAKATGLSVGAGRRLYRGQVTIPASSTKYAFFGVNADTAGAAPSGGTTNSFLMGISTNQIQIIKGVNLTGALSNPFPTATVPAGTYDATILIDETSVVLSMATATPAQAVYSVSIPRAGMPSGAINNIVFSNNDTTGTGILWGPVVQVTDLCPPPKSGYSPGSVTLFGSAHPFMFNRVDPVTGSRHIIYVPGSYDPRQPSPVVTFLHESVVGDAASPYQESKWANVLAAFDAAGYILVSSDNGTSTTGGGVTAPSTGGDDNYGDQVGLNDYYALIAWTRQHFNTGAVFLLGASLGGEFVQNILAQRTVGGIAAVASISPSTDLDAVYALGSPYQQALLDAYGVTTQAQLDAYILANDLNPIKHTATQLRGVPQRFYIGTADTLTPEAVHITPMVAKLAGYVPECNVVEVASVGHVDPALYQGSDLVAFFGAYR